MGLAFIIVLTVLVGMPAFIVGRQTRAAMPGLAFVPVIGAMLVTLRSIGWNSWWVLLWLVPIAQLALYVAVAAVVPREHGRNAWWTLPFLVPGLNLIAFYAYAFTLNPGRSRVGEPRLAKLPDA